MATTSRARGVALVLCAALAVCAPIATVASASPAAADATASDSHGSHGPHPHYALTYLVFMLFVGALCYQFDSSIPIPYTVTLLGCGGIIGLIHEATDKGLGRLSVSIDQWTAIDPHLLLFVFLPALLFGDAISMEFASIRKAFPQMLILATFGASVSRAASPRRRRLASSVSYPRDDGSRVPTPTNIF